MQLASLLLVCRSQSSESQMQDDLDLSLSKQLAQVLDQVLLAPSYELDLAHVVAKSVDAARSAENEDVITRQPTSKALSDDDSDLSDEDGDANARVTLTSTKQHKVRGPRTLDQTRKVHEACLAWSMLLRLAQFGIIGINNLSYGLAQFGRISSTFDALVKAATEVLKKQASSPRYMSAACEVIEESFAMVSL